MIRTVVENLLLFLLPTFIYVAWTLFQRAKEAPASDIDDNTNPGTQVRAVLNDAPLLWLFATGAIFVTLTLAFFGSSSGGKPGQQYQPSILKDGRIQPSRID